MQAKIFHALVVVAALAAVTACATPSPTFSPATLLPDVIEDTRTLIQPNNDARRAAVVALAERAGFTPTLHAFENDGRAGGDTRPIGHNIVISVGVGEPALVVGAHFDAAYLRDGTFLDGMVDNAASVVALLRAAETLREIGIGRRIDFVLFDMEEIGLVGSRHYAASLAPGSVKAMVNLDINAYGDAMFYGQSSHGHVQLYRALAAVCAARGDTCIEFERYPASDHLSFQRVGIPNISLSVLPRAEIHQLWLMMHAGDESGLANSFAPSVFRTIHTAGDTIDRVDPAAVSLAYKILIALLLELSQ